MNKTVVDLLEDFGLRHARVVHENEKRLRGDGQIQKLEEQKRALLMQKLECAFWLRTKEISTRRYARSRSRSGALPKKGASGSV